MALQAQAYGCRRLMFQTRTFAMVSSHWKVDQAWRCAGCWPGSAPCRARLCVCLIAPACCLGRAR